MTFIPSLTFTELWVVSMEHLQRVWLASSDAYPSGHLVPSPILGLANAPIVETKFFELAMSLLDFSPRIPLGTFSILLLVEWKYPVVFPTFSTFFASVVFTCRVLRKVNFHVHSWFLNISMLLLSMYISTTRQIIEIKDKDGPLIYEAIFCIVKGKMYSVGMALVIWSF